MSFIKAFDPPDKEDNNDILFVLVHGLDGDSDTFTNEETEQSMTMFLQSSFPRCRVLKYKYPNNSLHNVSNLNPLPLKDRGINFLQGLYAYVKDSECGIHFIGHSMGGLVIKQCLWVASQSNVDRYKNIYQRTQSVAFYATPHCGSYLADIYSSIGITTNSVNELKANNLFLTSLKTKFNEIIAKKRLKILSMVEGQKVMGMTKIVQNESAICGVDNEFEDVHILDFDHSAICKPLRVTDRRFLDYFNFVRTNFVSSSSSMDVEDEKEGAIGQNVQIFDPLNDGLNETLIAMERLEKNQNLENFTSVLSAMFKEESMNLREQKIANLFRNDVVRQNNKILENLLNTKELIDLIDQKRIKKSVALSMRYWDLLQESKSSIRLKKDQIETLLSCCKQWDDILTKQRNLKQGQTVSEDEIDFIELVCDEFKEWFKDEDKLKSIKDKWRALHGELRSDEMWWKKKKTQVVDFLKEQKDKFDEAARKKLEECDSWMNTLIAGVGTLCVAAGAIAFVVSGGAAICAAAVSITATVSGAIGYCEAQRFKKETDKEVQLLRMKSAKSEKTAAKMEKIAKAFKEMTQDSTKIEGLFNDFMDALRQPKKASGKVDQMHKKQKYKWSILQFHVKSIIKSFELLEKTSDEILQAIQEAQNKFNSDE